MGRLGSGVGEAGGEGHCDVCCDGTCYSFGRNYVEWDIETSLLETPRWKAGRFLSCIAINRLATRTTPVSKTRCHNI